MLSYTPGAPNIGKIKQRFGARNISGDENIYLYMFEEPDRSGPPPALAPIQRVYKIYLSSGRGPCELALVADVMYHYSL